MPLRGIDGQSNIITCVEQQQKNSTSWRGEADLGWHKQQKGNYFQTPRLGHLACNTETMQIPLSDFKTQILLKFCKSYIKPPQSNKPSNNNRLY